MPASRWLSCCPDVARIALIWVIILISLIADISADRPHRLNAVTVNSWPLWLELLLTMICGSKRSQRIKIDERYMEETFFRHCSGLNQILDCQLRQFFDEALLNCSPDLIQNCCHSQIYGPSLSKSFNKVQIYGLVWKCLNLLLYMSYICSF